MRWVTEGLSGLRMSKVTKWPLEQGSLLTECREAPLSSLSENSIFLTRRVLGELARLHSHPTSSFPPPARKNPQTLARGPPPCSHWVASSFLHLPTPIFFSFLNDWTSTLSIPAPDHGSLFSTHWTPVAPFSSLASELLIHPQSKGYWVHLTVARALGVQAPPPAPTPPTTSLLSTSQASHSITQLPPFPPPGFIRDSSAPPSQPLLRRLGRSGGEGDVFGGCAP